MPIVTAAAVGCVDTCCCFSVSWKYRPDTAQAPAAAAAEPPEQPAEQLAEQAAEQVAEQPAEQPADHPRFEPPGRAAAR